METLPAPPAPGAAPTSGANLDADLSALLFDEQADPAVVSEQLRARPLAMLECAVVVSETRRTPSRAATSAARANLAALDGVAPAAIRDALTRMLVCREVDVALQWLHQAGLLGKYLPELEVTVDFSQEAGRKHKDVWEHTKQVVRQAVPRPLVRWAALLHDIGKVPTRTFTGDGKVHFHGHSEVGARMFDPIARRFAFDRPERDKIRFLILHHLRANQYETGWTDSAIRRFEREMCEHLDDLLDLSRADITSRRPGRRNDLLAQISELSRRIEALRAEDAKQPPLPTGVGNEIMTRFALPPSRLIGDLKRKLDAAIESGELEPRRECGYYCDWLDAQGAIPKPTAP